VAEEVFEREELVRVCLVEANGEGGPQRASVTTAFARPATQRSVSQITFGERSDLRTLAGRLFGITYSAGPTATSFDSHAALRIATSSSGIGFTTTLPPGNV
jgi:hypothetical protein